MEWIRGMAKGKWVKGNGIRPGGFTDFMLGRRAEQFLAK